MSDEKKRTLHRETFFLPPLQMILSGADKKARPTKPENQDAENRKVSEEKTVVKLIEKLSEKEE